MKKLDILTIAGLYLLLILTAALYWPGLHGPMLLDDYQNLESVFDLGKGGTTWLDAVRTNPSGPLGRPIAMLTFVANELFNGGAVWSFKYTNLMIHLLCGVLIFWLVGRLLIDTRFEGQRWPLALGTAALWLLAPMQVSTVLYVVQRMAQLSALFVLAGLLVYTVGRQLQVRQSALGHVLVLTTFLFFLPLAILSKENGALLPVLAFVLELCFFRFRAAPKFLACIYSIFLLAPAIATVVLISKGYLINGYATRDFNLTERLLTETRILFTYVFNLLVPNTTQFGLYHDDYGLSKNLFTPFTTLLSVLGWGVLILASLYSLIKNNTAKFFFFGLLFFIGGQLLESSIFPLELYFEHRNYLPSVGIYFSASLLIFYLIQKINRKRMITTLALLIPVAYTGAAYQQIMIWTSWDNILLTAEEYHPYSPRLLGDLSVYYNLHYNPDKALFYVKKMISINPRMKSAGEIFKIGIACYNNIKNIDYNELENNLSFNGDLVATQNAMMIIEMYYKEKRCDALDITKFSSVIDHWLSEKKAYRHPETQWLGWIYTAKMLFQDDKPREAIKLLTKAANVYPERLDPDIIKIQYQLAINEISDAKNTLLDLENKNNGKRLDFDLFISELKKQFKRTPKD